MSSMVEMNNFRREQLLSKRTHLVGREENENTAKILRGRGAEK